MFPSNFFNLFPPFPRDNSCFVAMSFAPDFDFRWEKVLEPAIRSVRVNNEPLEPIRVSENTINDSILTEILTGISRSRIILADITSLATLNDRPVRNENVMYEVGLAHAMRLPAEIVMFRSDDHKLSFDITNVRVNPYDPDGAPDKAIRVVQKALLNGINEVNQLKNLSVQRAVGGLDLFATSMIFEIAVGNMKNVGKPLKSPAMSRLLEEQILEAEYIPVTLEKVRSGEVLVKDLCNYRLTAFGQAVYQEILFRMDISKVAEYKAQVQAEKAVATDTTVESTESVSSTSRPECDPTGDQDD